MIEEMKHFCGVFGVIGSPNAAKETRLGLYSLQHRGQESAGIVSTDGVDMFEHKGLGLVNEVFPDDKYLSILKGESAIGHNRYSTTGSTLLVNAQPFLIKFHSGYIAAAHNGNLVNAEMLRKEMERDGSIFRTTTDSEIILHLIAKSKYSTIPEMVADAVQKIEGAFSLLFLTGDKLIGVKDRHSFRPLVLGKKNNAWYLASETCAFDIIGAKYIRSLKPGEMVVIDKNKMEPEFFYPFGNIEPANSASCIFEFIYFSRPDSVIFDAHVDNIRREMGRQLAKDHPANADIVISVPDSSNTAALGFSEESGIPFELGLIRNHYIGRTFIEPTQYDRENGVRLKYNPVRNVLEGKRLVVVDDSIVRGTTSRKLVYLLRDAGVAEIHMRIASPPIINPCFYGIDTPDKKKLIGSQMSITEIKNFLGVDSIGYLSMESMLATKTLPNIGYCTACFGGEYPTAIEDSLQKNKMG